MRFLVQLTAAALLVAIGIGGTTAATAADREARAAVLGRQKIRAELSAALVKGYLTRMDQYQILLHAKEVLTADDLHGLELTLDRIAKQQATARHAATAVRSETPVPQSDDSQPAMIRPSKYEETQGTEMPVIGAPMPRKAMPLGQSPFVEEGPARIGQPAIHLDGQDPEGCGCGPEGCGCNPEGCRCGPDGCGCCPDECRACRRWIDIDCFSSVDAFKGPLDFGNANGNFGVRMGANAAVPIYPCLGVGLQAGAATVLSNLKGSPYTESDAATVRDQIFATVGMFQRISHGEGTFTWGFAYDWLFDDYYADFQFGQWRVKAAYEFNPCDEIGVLAALPDHGSSGALDSVTLSFKPITQGYVYWRHTWCNDASLAGRFGVAERPGEFVFGGESRVPLTKHLALTGDFSYIMPNAAGGAIGQTREIWDVSVGIEFVLGGFGHGCARHCQPFLPVADNGSLAVRGLGL